MAIAKHRLSVLDGSTQQFNDKVVLGVLQGIANSVGGGAGQNVATVVTLTEPLPANFTALVQCNQSAISWISAKTTFGFTVNITPLLAANTLAAGTFDVVILG